jgi:hypothetical protein
MVTQLSGDTLAVLKCCGRWFSTPVFVFGRRWVRISVWWPVFLYEFFRMFSLATRIDVTVLVFKVKVKYPPNRPTWPWGVREVTAPGFLDNRNINVVRFSALRTVFTPRNILVLISKDWVDPGHMDLSDASEKSPVKRPGIDPGTLRLVAQRLNHYATTGPLYLRYVLLFYLLIINQSHDYTFIRCSIKSNTKLLFVYKHALLYHDVFQITIRENRERQLLNLTK